MSLPAASESRLPAEQASSGLSAARLAAWLCISLLTLPVALFAATWLKPIYAVPTMLALFVLAWRARGLFSSGAISKVTISGGELTALLLVCALLTVLAGVGGYMPYQSTDWDKHNSVINLLMAAPWPFTVTVEGKGYTLAYHTAYHLFPALAGKAGGWPAANAVLLLQTSAGLAGTLLLARAVSGASLLVVITAALCFTGLDILPNIARSLLAYGNAGEWWLNPFSYQNNIHQLLYMPNQAIVGWMGAALLYSAHRSNRILETAAFIVPVSLLWASFVTFGLIMLAVPLWLLGARDKGVRVRRFSDLGAELRRALPDLALGAVVAAVITAYLFLLFRLDRAVFDPDATSLPYASEVTSLDGSLAYPLAYAAFVMVEFMALALLLALRREWQDRTQLLILLATSAVLLAIPLIRIGFINDFALKASIAPLFMLQLLAMAAWVRGSKITRRLIGGYLLIAAASGAASLLLFVRGDVGDDLVGRNQYPVELACQHNRYLESVRLNYLSQYLGPYGGDWLAEGLLAEARGEQQLSLAPSPACAAALRANQTPPARP